MQHEKEILCRYRLKRAKEESAVQIEHAEAFVKTVEMYISKNDKEKQSD